MLQHYKYPLKVWLTSALLGSIGLFITYYIYERDMFIAYNLISYFMPATLYIVLGAIPFWICLWYVYSRIAEGGKHRRILLLLTAELLGFTYLAIMFANEPSRLNAKALFMITSFVAAIAISVFIYPINKVKPKDATA